MATGRGPDGDSLEEVSEYTTTAFLDHANVTGAPGDSVMTLSQDYSVSSVELTAEEQNKFLKVLSDKYRDCVQKQCEEIEKLKEENENFIKESEELKKKNEQLENEIEEKGRELTKWEDEGKQQQEYIIRLRTEFFELTEEREKSQRELEFRNQIARTMTYEKEMLEEKLGEAQRLRIKYEALAKQTHQEKEKLCEALKAKDDLLNVCMAQLYRGILFYQKGATNSWKIIFVIIKDNPWFYLHACQEHGKEVISFTFNIVKRTVKLSFESSRSLPMWKVSPDPLPQLNKETIDEFDLDKALPSIVFWVECESETCSPTFRHRFRLEGTTEGLLEPKKFFTVCLPH